MMAGSVLTTLPVLLVFLALAALLHRGPDGRERQGMTATVSARAWAAAAGAACIAALAFFAVAHLPQVVSAAERRARSCSTTSPTSRRGRPSRPTACARRSAPRSARSGTGAAPRFRPRAAPPATPSLQRALPLELAGQLRDHVLRARRRAGQRFPGQAVDASGDNVWWFAQRELRVSPRVATGADQEAADRVRVGADRRIARCSASATIEFVVAAGRGGGAGSVYVEPTWRCARCRRAPAPLPCPWRARARRSRRRRARAARSTATPPRRGAAIPCAGPRAAPHARFRRARASSAASSCAGATAGSHRATTCSSPTMARDGERCAASTTATAAPTRSRCPTPRRAIVRLALARRPGARLRARRSRGQATSPSARRRTRSSRRSRASRRAATFRAASPASSPTGRSSASTAAARAACCPRTARSKSARGGFSIEPFVVVGLASVVDLGRRRTRSRSSRRLPADARRALATVRAGSCSVTTFARRRSRRVAARRALRRRATRPIGR